MNSTGTPLKSFPSICVRSLEYLQNKEKHLLNEKILYIVYYPYGNSLYITRTLETQY